MSERGRSVAPAGRAEVRKTYKLFVGGAFPRSESGRSYVVTGHDGGFLANAALASRKDVRDAVAAARAAFPGWSSATAYNRGQVLYRVAEMLEQGGADLAAAAGAGEGGARAGTELAAAVDRLVWYAGWSDKVAQVAGGSNPVAGPYFNFSIPEPAGVIGILAPQRSPLLGLVSVLAPAIVTGNTAVVVASEEQPLPALAFAEVLATSDVPAGVVNILTGRTAELAPVLASHRDVDGLDLAGAPAGSSAELERAAATNVKRVLPAPAPGAGRPGGPERSGPERSEPERSGPERSGPDWSEPDWSEPPGTRRLLAFLETKTVWHPIGA